MTSPDLKHNQVSEEKPNISVTQRIVTEISNRIIDGIYKPGMSLREIPLSEQFGVSRGSLREALRILERDGVVTIEPRRGASVTSLSADELIEIYQVRRVLLGLAMAMACERFGDDDAKWITDKLTILQENIHGPDPAASSRHATVSAEMASYFILLSGNQRLEFLLTHMSAQIARYTRIGVATSERRISSLATWTELLDAMNAHDPTAAERLGRKLVADTLHFALTRIAGLD